MTWDTIKTFRVYNNHKRLSTNEKACTVTFVPRSKELWVRSIGDIESNDGDTRQLRLGWQPPADTWVTLRLVFDYDENTFEFSARNTGGTVLYERHARVRNLRPIDNVAPLLHSSSRSHGGIEQEVPDTFLGYRNVRVGIERTNTAVDSHH